MGLAEIRDNPIMLTDTYNISHEKLKCNTDFEVSHIYNRARGMILYGFSELVKSILSVQITMDMIDEAEWAAEEKGIEFPRDMWERVVTECNGYVPLHIQCLPEGMWVAAGTPFCQIRNTVEGFGELVTWFEAPLLHNAFASGCATRGFLMRKYLLDRGLPMIKIHSFGFRGHNSLENAYWAGTAWNLTMVGTDDFHTKKHTPKAKIGSIPAQAHKVTQQFDKEYDSFIHAIDYASTTKYKTIALVIDTYDANRFIKEYLVKLAMYAVLKGVHIVCRPDSGEVLKQAIEIYRVCKANNIKNVSVIIGEGITFDKIVEYDNALRSEGVPLEFVSYGIGAGFYKDIDRDWLGFAMKTAFSNGKPRMKFGMTALKRSIPDKIAIIDNHGDLLVIPESDEDSKFSLYKDVYYHDDLLHSPFMQVADWNETQERVLKQKDDQQVIYVDKAIEDMISEFKKTYKG